MFHKREEFMNALWNIVFYNKKKNFFFSRKFVFKKKKFRIKSLKKGIVNLMKKGRVRFKLYEISYVESSS